MDLFLILGCMTSTSSTWAFPLCILVHYGEPNQAPPHPPISIKPPPSSHHHSNVLKINKPPRLRSGYIVNKEMLHIPGGAYLLVLFYHPNQLHLCLHLRGEDETRISEMLSSLIAINYVDWSNLEIFLKNDNYFFTELC